MYIVESRAYAAAAADHKNSALNCIIINGRVLAVYPTDASERALMKCPASANGALGLVAYVYIGIYVCMGWKSLLGWGRFFIFENIFLVFTINIIYLYMCSCTACKKGVNDILIRF